MNKTEQSESWKMLPRFETIAMTTDWGLFLITKKHKLIIKKGTYFECFDLETELKKEFYEKRKS